MAIDKVLGLQGASITWTNKQISKMIDKDSLSFRNVVQRGTVWEKWRMSELIWSIINNFPIPPIYCERSSIDSNDKIKHWDCLDGQQRCTTIHKFLNDEFALTKLKPIYYLDENGTENFIDISGLKFSELDEELQDIIRDATISVRYYDDLPQFQKAEMFRRLNQNKPLTAKNKTLASAKDIETLLDIGSHELFNQMLTEKSKANKNQAVITAKVLTMLNKQVEEISFASKDFNPEIENLEISDEEKQELSTVFDYIVNVHEELISNHEKDIAKKLYREIHLISLVPFIKRSLENNIGESMFAEYLVSFFKTENDSDVYSKYMEATSNAVARTANIVARHNALEASYNIFFKEDNMEKIS